MNPKILQLLDVLMSHNIHFIVTSAYRTKQQNITCGGARNSQHLTGDAIDIAPYGTTTLTDLYAYIKCDFPCDYDQLILYKTFVHVSYTRDDIKPRKQLIRK